MNDFKFIKNEEETPNGVDFFSDAEPDIMLKTKIINNIKREKKKNLLSYAYKVAAAILLLIIPIMIVLTHNFDYKKSKSSGVNQETVSLSNNKTKDELGEKKVDKTKEMGKALIEDKANKAAGDIKNRSLNNINEDASDNKKFGTTKLDSDKGELYAKKAPSGVASKSRTTGTTNSVNNKKDQNYSIAMNSQAKDSKNDIPKSNSVNSDKIAMDTNVKTKGKIDSEKKVEDKTENSSLAMDYSENGKENEKGTDMGTSESKVADSNPVASSNPTTSPNQANTADPSGDKDANDKSSFKAMMTDDTSEKYIEVKFTEGVSLDSIKAFLKSVGITEYDVKEGFVQLIVDEEKYNELKTYISDTYGKGIDLKEDQGAFKDKKVFVKIYFN